MNNYFGNYKGIVVKSIPNKNGICKIYVPDIYPEEYREKPDLLPDAIPVIPIGFNNDGNTNGLFATPKENSIVCVFFDGGNINYPFYFGVIPAGTNYDYLSKLSKENTNITHNTNKINFDSTINDISDYNTSNSGEQIDNSINKISDILSDKINIDDLVNGYIAEETANLTKSVDIFSSIGQETSKFLSNISGEIEEGTGKFIKEQLSNINQETIGGMIESFTKLTEFIEQTTSKITTINQNNMIFNKISDILANNQSKINDIINSIKSKLAKNISFLPTEEEGEEELEEESKEEIIIDEDSKKAIVTNIFLKEKSKNITLSNSDILKNICGKYNINLSDNDLNSLSTQLDSIIDNKIMHITTNQQTDLLLNNIRNTLESIAPTLQILTFILPEISKAIVTPLQGLIKLGNILDISIRDKGDGNKAIYIQFKGDVNVIHEGNVFSITNGNNINITTKSNVRLASNNFDIPPATPMSLIFGSLISEEGTPLDESETNTESIYTQNFGSDFDSNIDYTTQMTEPISLNII